MSNGLSNFLGIASLVFLGNGSTLGFAPKTSLITNFLGPSYGTSFLFSTTVDLITSSSAAGLLLLEDIIVSYLLVTTGYYEMVDVFLLLVISFVVDKDFC